MAVIKVDANDTEDKVIVSGDIDLILNNRRAMRLLKDNSVFRVEGDRIIFDVGDDLNKCIGRIQSAAKYVQCGVELQGNADSGIQAYYQEEKNFEEFSKKALDIRNNECDVNEFNAFKDSLIDNLPNRTLYDLQMLAAYHLAFHRMPVTFLFQVREKQVLYMGLMHT